MNNPLEDLMYRAGLTAQGCWDSMDEYDREAIEKFAELIVRECIDAVIMSSDRHRKEYFAALIKEHFGLKESDWS